MKDTWVINYKRRCFQFNIDNNISFKIQVTISNDSRFDLFLENKNEDPIFIAKSNNLQILKDLVRSIESNLDVERIYKNFYPLNISNLSVIIPKLKFYYETENHIS